MRHLWYFVAIALACAIPTSNAQDDFRTTVGLVPVSLSASDLDHHPVLDLTASEFVLLDNGKPRKIQYVWREADLPLTIGIVIDASGSQERYVNEHRQSVAKFLQQVLRPQDQAFIVALGPRVVLITDLTNKVEDLQAGVNHVDPRELFSRELSSDKLTNNKLANNDDQSQAGNFGDQCGTALPAGVHSPHMHHFQLPSH